MTKKQSLRKVAARSSGRSFQCSRCPIGPLVCSPQMCKFCHEEYIRAFIKGYKQAKKDTSI